jgi:hypothetical protein
MPVVIRPGGLPWLWKRDSVRFVILLAAPAESSLAAKKKWRQSALGKATSTPKNRVGGFGNTPSGRPDENVDLSWETATGSVQFAYESASGRGVFISRDPLSGAEFSQGTNLYAYCANNYLNLSDPTGKSWGSAALSFAEGAVVGVAITAAIVVAAPEIAAVAAAGLVAVGVSEVAAAATVTGAAAVAAGVGTAAAVVNTAGAVNQGIQTGNWDQAAFDAGSIVGAGGVTASSMVSSGWSLAGDQAMGYNPALGSATDWLATMPTPSSGTLAASAAAAGIATSDGKLLKHGCGQ